MIKTRDTLEDELFALAGNYQDALLEIEALERELQKFRAQIMLSSTLGVPTMHYSDVIHMLDYIAHHLQGIRT